MNKCPVTDFNHQGDSSPKLYDEGGYFVYACPECLFFTDKFKTEEEASGHWQRRSEIRRTAKEFRELKVKIK